MRADTELHAGKRTTCRQALHDFGGTPAPEGHYAATGYQASAPAKDSVRDDLSAPPAMGVRLLP